MHDLTKLSARDAATAIRNKEISSLELVDACLTRIEARDPVVGAWAYIDPEAARAHARACDAQAPVGVLHGVPVGIKDVIETGDMPTEYGSALHRGHRPLRDAACVSLIRKAGGIAMGKTVSTEFAMYQPNKTANPHNPAHTPGGSSSGSAAAVADYQVPLALGTQTSGSIIRPAAFCGVAGYKPTFGTFAIEGIKTLAASLDTLGCLARHVDDVLLLSEALYGASLPSPVEEDRKPVIGFWYPPFASMTADEDGLSRALTRLKDAGHTLREVTMPDWVTPLNDSHADLMAFEVARNHVYEFEAVRRDGMAAATAGVMAQGWKIPLEVYLKRRDEQRRARIEMAQWIAPFDILLVPSALGEAPAGLAATGDPVYNRIWSLLGFPALSLPVGTGPRGLPLGVQLIARPDQDLAMLRLAAKIEAIVAG
jgi:Asp-tRNA(Asn)/Glu-tRNA(Gln) amidotransferase A subunit family amidase